MRHRGSDALNRLLAADFSSWNGSGWTGILAYDLEGMQYDRAGNLTVLQRYGPSGTLLDNLTYAYTAATNHLASVTDLVGATGETWDAESGGFTYDANGNMVTGPAPYGMTAVTYDHRNLPLVMTANGVTSAYRYDEQGQRISKQVGGGNSEYYVLDGRTSLGVVTVDGAGNTVTWTWNVLAGDKVVGRETSGLRYYYHTDLLGSTRAVVQGATVVEAYDYDPGTVRLDGRTLAGPTKEGFTTKERDAESGLDYFGARYYMAALGRWTSVDPLVDSFPAWNGYNYVEDNPNDLADPDGTCPCTFVAQLLAFKFAERHPIAAERIATLITQEVQGFACGAAGDCTNPPPSGGLGFLLGKLALVAPTANAGRLVGATGVGEEAAMGATAARGGGRSLADQAGELVGKNGGRNRVTLRSPSQKMEVDLAGKAHGGVATPHTKVSPRNPNAPNQPAYNTRNVPVSEATQQDMRTVRRYLERQDGN